MSDAEPFLDLDKRVAYLYERGYFPAGSMAEEYRVRLASMNFHYFLGYARNYRGLAANEPALVRVASPDDVFRVIDRDHSMAQLIYKGLRQAEWTLRALAVEEYCYSYDSCGSYLREEQYRRVSDAGPAEMVRSIISSVLRHGEPFVVDHIKEKAGVRGIAVPKKYDAAMHADLVCLIEDLPLWAVVDSFSLGLLSRFITQCDGDKDPGDALWRRVADGLDVRHPVFNSNIESLSVLRNLVSHHARMWMRPTTVTPKKPKVFDKTLRGVDPKAMMVAFANVALFQGPASSRAFLAEVVDELDADPLYARGVTKVTGGSAA